MPALADLARVNGRGLDERAPEKERHERSDRADYKRNSPPPRVQLRRRQELLQDDEDQHREQLTTNQRDVLKSRIKSPASGNGDFAHVCRARAVLSADGESLYETRHQQEHGRGSPDCRVGRQHRYHQRAGAHRQDGNHHRGAAAGFVGDPPEQPAPERPDKETCGKDSGGVQQLRGAIAGGKESGSEVQRREGVDIEVVPLDEISRRGPHDREDGRSSGPADFVRRLLVVFHLSARNSQ